MLQQKPGCEDTGGSPCPQGECPLLNLVSSSSPTAVTPFPINHYAPIEVHLSGTGILPLGNLLTPLGAFALGNDFYGAFSFTAPDLTPHVQIAKFTGTNQFVAIGEQLGKNPAQIFPTVQIGKDQKKENNNYFSDRFFNIAFAVPSVAAPVDFLPEGVTNPVFVWGRASFYRADVAGYHGARYQQLTDLHLMVLNGDNLEAAPYYLTSFDHSKPGVIKPFWSQSGLPLAIISGPDDVAFPYQMSVAYDPNLELWVMLYGGSGYESLGATQLSGGIQVRLAHNPWGPWSQRMAVYGIMPPGMPTNSKLFPSTAPATRDKTLYNPKLNDAGGVEADLVHDDLAHSTNKDKTPGIEYGASLWSGATYPYKKGGYEGATIYFLMSTYNPYHPVLMKMVLARKSGV